MTGKQIACADLDKLLDRLLEKASVYAPFQDAAGDVALAEAKPGKAVALKYSNFSLSPKAFFLPQTQTLLRFKDRGTEEPPLPDHETLLFGVRPCDARALLALDKVFLDGDAADPYYARLRGKTAVIALACTAPTSTCFCTSVGAGPADPAGADVLAVEVGTDLLFRAQTPRGEELLSSAGDLLATAAPSAVQEAEERIRTAEDQIAPVNVFNSAERLRHAYHSPQWEAAGQKCLGCGACSFLCPTCHCFDITDEVRGGVGHRVRTWDSCAYPLFTLHASGHNPRPAPKERWRQRVMHKFRYAVENFHVPFCVGCGRCIRHCPAGMDLRKLLREV